MPAYPEIKQGSKCKIICDHCGKEDWKHTGEIARKIKKGNASFCCSEKCAGIHRKKERIICNCQQCGKEVERTHSDFLDKNRKSTRMFCNSVCSGKYSAQHKVSGNNRSNLESWLETNLNEKYPCLEIQYNQTNAIGAELDIFFPSLNYAVEINGIFHYEPIFGEEQLRKTQRMDRKKLIRCRERGITLTIIDTTSQRQFAQESSQKYFDIISNAVDSMYTRSAGEVPVMRPERQPELPPEPDPYEGCDGVAIYYTKFDEKFVNGYRQNKTGKRMTVEDRIRVSNTHRGICKEIPTTSPDKNGVFQLTYPKCSRSINSEHDNNCVRLYRKLRHQFIQERIFEILKSEIKNPS